MPFGVLRSYKILHDADTCENTPKDIEKMETRIVRDPSLVNKKFRDITSKLNKITPADSAAISGHDNCLQYLVNKGSKLSIDNDDIMLLTILTLDFNCIKILLENGFSANYDCKSQPIRGTTFYLYLTSCGTECPHIGQLFIDHGAKVDDFHNFNISMKDYFVHAPSIVAITYKHPAYLLLLLSNGAAVDHLQIKNTDNISTEMKDALSLIHHHVISAGKEFSHFLTDLHILNVLYEFGANLWQKNRLNMSPLEVREDRDIWLSERRFRGISSEKDRVLPLAYSRFTEKLKEFMSKPRSLRSCSRLAIVRSLGQNYMKNIGKLPPCPSEVLSYLNFDDLRIDGAVPMIFYGTDI